MNVGEKLRLARMQADKTLREIEEETGLSKDTISRIERGLRKPQPLTVAKLARAYRRPAEVFLDPKAEALYQSQSLKEAFEAGQTPVVSTALDSYVESRAKMYEKELKDPNSPHFRDATTATLWVEMLQREANMLVRLAIDEASPIIRHFGTVERGWAGVEVLRHLALFGEARKQADKRISGMKTKPDELAQKKLEKTQREAQEIARPIDDIRKAVGT